jgi:glycolate oxidase
MALASDVYRALEDIVGPENISDELAVLDSYAFQWLMELRPTGQGDRFGVRPEAIVLPGSTEEVQAIVKTCNRLKKKFKAFSTGWGAYGGPGNNDVIQLDMRRMNRIVEIDEKNMYAVVEPYVIGAQLQAELMKRGFNCHIITGGSNASVLPLTAMSGEGYTTVSTSMHGRNTLGVEWVLPTGEILKLGSLGSGAGWFCGDGPGPSLKGMVRGIEAVAGGLGIFTKAATKIYHWPGPPTPHIEGVSPRYMAETLPEIHCHYPVFPSIERLAEAGMKIAESEIANILVQMQKYRIASDIATSNEEGAELYSRILKESKDRPGLLVFLQANSRKESAYQDKVLRQILADTEGEYLPLVEEDKVQQGMIWRFIRISTGSRHHFRFTGSSTVFGRAWTGGWLRLPDIRRGEVSKGRMKNIQEGLLLYEEIDDGSSICSEFGHIMLAGFSVYFDFMDPQARQSAVQLSREMSILSLEKYKITPKALGPDDHDRVGLLQSNYHVWLRKIKKAFDPNTVSEPNSYISAEKPKSV